jgi:galactokinase/mevalonate kinase-like predicted kinase
VGYQLWGYSLLGAGGGGFALLIAKDESAAARVRRMLEHAPPSPTARFYDFAIDSKGLGVSRL